MKSPIILEGRPFDWEFGNEASKHILNEDEALTAEVHEEEAPINWGAAMCADPGVMKCPGCGAFLWNEGDRVRCPDCGHEWRTDGT
jgi:hypothetical protein